MEAEKKHLRILTNHELGNKIGETESDIRGKKTRRNFSLGVAALCLVAACVPPFGVLSAVNAGFVLLNLWIGSAHQKSIEAMRDDLQKLKSEVALREEIVEAVIDGDITTQTALKRVPGLTSSFKGGRPTNGNALPAEQKPAPSIRL